MMSNEEIVNCGFSDCDCAGNSGFPQLAIANRKLAISFKPAS